MPDSYKIFLADDDEDDRFLFEQAIRDVSSDSQLITAENGERLITLLSQYNSDPHLIILDINMPRKNGLVCLKELRLMSKYRNTPVVIFSTSIESRHVEKALEEGANYCIRKPSSYTILKEIASFCLEICADRKPAVKKKFLAAC